MALPSHCCIWCGGNNTRMNTQRIIAKNAYRAERRYQKFRSPRDVAGYFVLEHTAKGLSAQDIAQMDTCQGCHWYEIGIKSGGWWILGQKNAPPGKIAARLGDTDVGIYSIFELHHQALRLLESKRSRQRDIFN